MNAQEALKLSESYLPPTIDKKYDSIMSSVKWAIKQGRTDFIYGFTPPCKEVVERLEKDGYWLYSVGDNFFIPTMYGISWKKQEPKKKWYHRIFGRC